MTGEPAGWLETDSRVRCRAVRSVTSRAKMPTKSVFNERISKFNNKGKDPLL